MTDLISRADAIEEISKGVWNVHELVDRIKALPSAEAVQGEWIHDGQNFKGGLDWCHCSVCGQKTSTHGLSMYNFCPNCGAIMKGGAE